MATRERMALEQLRAFADLNSLIPLMHQRQTLEPGMYSVPMVPEVGETVQVLYDDRVMKNGRKGVFLTDTTFRNPLGIKFVAIGTVAERFRLRADI